MQQHDTSATRLKQKVGLLMMLLGAAHPQMLLEIVHQSKVPCVLPHNTNLMFDVSPAGHSWKHAHPHYFCCWS
jgi:hypothetical protein